MTPVADNAGEFPRIGKDWAVFPMPSDLDNDPVERLDIGEERLLMFDCICNTAGPDTPGWDALPFDINFEREGVRTQTCSRCGRIYKLEIAWRVLLYTPLAIRYPGEGEGRTREGQAG